MVIGIDRVPQCAADSVPSFKLLKWKVSRCLVELGAGFLPLVLPLGHVGTESRCPALFDAGHDPPGLYGFELVVVVDECRADTGTGRASRCGIQIAADSVAPDTTPEETGTAERDVAPEQQTVAEFGIGMDAVVERQAAQHGRGFERGIAAGEQGIAEILVDVEDRIQLDVAADPYRGCRARRRCRPCRGSGQPPSPVAGWWFAWTLSRS